jgi:hypothetical protein
MLDAARYFFAKFELRGFGVRVSLVDMGEVSVCGICVLKPKKGRGVG